MVRFTEIPEEEWRRRIEEQRARIGGGVQLEEIFGSAQEADKYLIAEEGDYSELLNMLAGVAKDADMLSPDKVLVTNNRVAKASVIPSDTSAPREERKYILTLSEGAIRNLGHDDLAAIIRHELGHVGQDKAIKQAEKLPTVGKLERQVGGMYNVLGVAEVATAGSVLAMLVSQSVAVMGPLMVGAGLVAASGLLNTSIQLWRELDADRFSADVGGASAMSNALRSLEQYGDKLDVEFALEQKPSSNITNPIVSVVSKQIKDVFLGKSSHPPHSWRHKALELQARKQERESSPPDPSPG